MSQLAASRARSTATLTSIARGDCLALLDCVRGSTEPPVIARARLAASTFSRASLSRCCLLSEAAERLGHPLRCVCSLELAHGPHTFSAVHRPTRPACATMRTSTPGCSAAVWQALRLSLIGLGPPERHRDRVWLAFETVSDRISRFPEIVRAAAPSMHALTSAGRMRRRASATDPGDGSSE